ncbi:MAG: hypothetical protein LBT47_04760 [Deltaproteobacteria bacterium]|jgi:hypothetical protein|nr:hypothetical protein [Deltaproteobacteria bacterium]
MLSKGMKDVVRGGVRVDLIQLDLHFRAKLDYNSKYQWALPVKNENFFKAYENVHQKRP